MQEKDHNLQTYREILVRENANRGELPEQAPWAIEVPLLNDMRPSRKFTSEHNQPNRVLTKEGFFVGQIYRDIHLSTLGEPIEYPEFEVIGKPFEFKPGEWRVPVRTILNLPFDNRRPRTPSLGYLGVSSLPNPKDFDQWNWVVKVSPPLTTA